MKLETFFEKFDELSDTPNGVKQLRELVLQLAVEGGLVPHSAAEPAVPYASVEDATPINNSDVPENWRVVLLADAIKNRSGNSKLIKGKLHDEPAAGRFQGFSASGANVWCDGYEHEGQAIIISAVGARCGKAFKASGKWCAIANTNITRPEPSLFDFDFAYLVLNNEHFWVRGGSAQPFVKFPPSLDRHFALPPIAEQKRIVAKVDELMALCDRLEAQQQERETRHAALARASLARFADAPTPANLPFLFHPSYAIPPAALRKSIFTLAVQGKLVPQDPNDEPAASLISQIAEEKRRLVAARIIRDKDEAAPITDDELPFEVPYGWEWTRLSSITRRIHYGYTASAKSELKDVRLLRITDIQNNFVDWPSVPGCEIAKDDVAQYQLERSDILVARTGGTVGKTYLVQEVPVVAVFASYLIRIQGGTALFDSYLKLFLESPTYWVQLEEGARGAAQPNVNGQTLGRMVVSVPPLAEQRRIVAKVEQLMALVDALETQLAASRATAANLLSALVAEMTACRHAGASTPS